MSPIRGYSLPAKKAASARKQMAAESRDRTLNLADARALADRLHMTGTTTKPIVKRDAQRDDRLAAALIRVLLAGCDSDAVFTIRGGEGA